MNGNNNPAPSAPNKDGALPAVVPDNKVTVLPPSNLPALAVKINNEHREFIKAAQSAVTRSIACGEALIEAKVKVEAEQGPRGYWLRWLRENTILAERTAQIHMHHARHKLRLEELARSQGATIAELTMNQATKMISTAPKEGWDPPQLESEEDDSDGDPPPPQIEVPRPVQLQNDVSEIGQALIERLNELRQCAEPQAQQLAQWVIEQVQETGLV
jgi:hypothetical protein